MKKTIVALAALSAAAGAFAQSNVSIYGTLDASVAYVTNADGKNNVTLLNDSAISTSRWGLRGSEDLGGGLKANFNLESDINMDTGKFNAAGMFRRSAYVSLSSDQYGELRLGQATSNAVTQVASGGIVLPSNAMHGSMLIASGVAGDFFVNNAITYISPALSGVKASLLYAPGEVAGAGSTGSKIHAAVKYTGDGFTLGGTYIDVKESGAGNKDGRTWYTIDGTVTLGQVKLGAVYYDVDHGSSVVTAKDNQGYILNASYQLDPKVTLFAGFIKSLQDSSLVSLQARYALSKRTTLYALVSRADNGNEGVNFPPLYDTTSGQVTGTGNTKQTGIAMGVMHSF